MVKTFYLVQFVINQGFKLKSLTTLGSMFENQYFQGGWTEKLKLFFQNILKQFHDLFKLILAKIAPNNYIPFPSIFPELFQNCTFHYTCGSPR
jgi:hypothetical protein